jgi:hypothetical protein
MRKIREALRLKHALGLSERQMFEDAGVPVEFATGGDSVLDPSQSASGFAGSR